MTLISVALVFLATITLGVALAAFALFAASAARA